MISAALEALDVDAEHGESLALLPRLHRRPKELLEVDGGHVDPLDAAWVFPLHVLELGRVHRAALAHVLLAHAVQLPLLPLVDVERRLSRRQAGESLGVQLDATALATNFTLKAPDRPREDRVPFEPVEAELRRVGRPAQLRRQQRHEQVAVSQLPVALADGEEVVDRVTFVQADLDEYVGRGWRSGGEQPRPWHRARGATQNATGTGENTCHSQKSRVSRMKDLGPVLSSSMRPLWWALAIVLCSCAWVWVERRRRGTTTAACAHTMKPARPLAASALAAGETAARSTFTPAQPQQNRSEEKLRSTRMRRFARDDAEEAEVTSTDGEVLQEPPPPTQQQQQQQRPLRAQAGAGRLAAGLRGPLGSDRSVSPVHAEAAGCEAGSGALDFWDVNLSEEVLRFFAADGCVLLVEIETSEPISLHVARTVWTDAALRAMLREHSARVVPLRVRPDPVRSVTTM